MQVAKWNPKVLIEIHGHGGKKAKHDVEISSGSSENDVYSRRLEAELIGKCVDNDELKSLNISGQYSSLYFKAGGSVTISDGRWIAYHIELPPRLRKSSDCPSGKPPEVGYKFCDALERAVRTIHRF